MLSSPTFITCPHIISNFIFYIDFILTIIYSLHLLPILHFSGLLRRIFLLPLSIF